MANPRSKERSRRDRGESRPRRGHINKALAPGLRGTSAANPKFAHHCCRGRCELRVQSGTRIIELLVSFDSEVRLGACCKVVANFGIGTLDRLRITRGGARRRSGKE